MSARDGGPAFPGPDRLASIPEGAKPQHQRMDRVSTPGMSLRDYAAIQFAAALLSDRQTIELAAKTAAQHGETPGQTVAEEAYQYADAMLAARNAPESAQEPADGENG